MIARKVVAIIEAKGLETSLPDSASRAQNVIDNSCLRCHEGDPDRMDLSNVAVLSDVQRLKILRMVSTGEMPKDSPELNLDAKNVLLTWLLETSE